MVREGWWSVPVPVAKGRIRIPRLDALRAQRTDPPPANPPPSACLYRTAQKEGQEGKVQRRGRVTGMQRVMMMMLVLVLAMQDALGRQQAARDQGVMERSIRNGWHGKLPPPTQLLG